MATLKERLNGELQEMIAERASLDGQIKQMRGVIQSLDGNGATPARRGRGAAKRRTKRRTTPAMPAEERGKQILEFVSKAKKPVTSNEVAEGLGLSKNNARKHVDALVKSGGLKDAGIRPRDPNSRGGREAKLFSLA